MRRKNIFLAQKMDHLKNKSVEKKHYFEKYEFSEFLGVLMSSEFWILNLGRPAGRPARLIKVVKNDSNNNNLYANIYIN